MKNVVFNGRTPSVSIPAGNNNSSDTTQSKSDGV